MPQSSELINQLVQLMEVHRAVFGQERVYLRAWLLVLGELFAFKNHRVTDLLRAMGLVEEDWTAWYRLFQRPMRFAEEVAGRIMLIESLKHVALSALFVIAIDCTQIARNSHRLEGSSWLKCPRNPPWRIGIHRGQRFLNGSWLTPLSNGFSRAIPLRWLPAFPAKAVLKAHEAQKEHLAGVEFVQWVSRQLAVLGRSSQKVLCLADGSYDKPEFWLGLPSGVTALVRTAKNRALCSLPAPYAGKGRRRIYGEAAPAPQSYLQLRDGWHTTHLTVRGRSRRTVYRVEGPFLRRQMPTCPLFLICVRGQAWRRGGRQKQRGPVFYLVNAVERDGQWCLPLPVETLLTWAWQRWELEVVHREVKSVFGLGDKQCHHPQAAVTSVQWSAWLYGLLSLVAYRAFQSPAPPTKTPAWYTHQRRWTFATVLDSFRAELWTDPEFRAILSVSPPNWPKIEALLADYCTARRITLEPAA